MDDTILKVAQIGGTFGAAFLSGKVASKGRVVLLVNHSSIGYIACFSYAGVPTLSEAPVNTLVKQFSRMYAIGKKSSPPIAIAATVCNGFCAYQSRGKSILIGGLVSPFAMYVAAAVSVMCIVPYTILYMEPAVNRMLLDLGSQVGKGVKAELLGVRERDIKKALIRWKGLNFVRAALAGMGTLFAAVAIVA